MGKKNEAGRIYFYLLVSLALLIPSGFYFLINGVLVVLLVLAFAKGSFRKYVFQLKDPKIWLPALLYFMTVAGLLLSSNNAKAVSYLSAYLPYLAPAFLITGPSLTTTQRTTILKAFVVSLGICLLACDLYGIVDIVRTNEKMILLNPGTWYFKFSSFGLTRFFQDWHPTYVSAFCVWSISFIVVPRLYQTAHPLFKKAVELLLLAFLFINIILLNSIASIIALCVLSILWFIHYLVRKKINPAFIALLFFLLIAGAIALFYINPFHNEKLSDLKERGLKITDKEEERNFLTIRMAKWISHVEVFKKYPVAGTTPADIGDERKKVYAEKGFDYLLTQNLNAHNQYLEMLCRFGLIGFVVFMLFLLVPFRQHYDPVYLSILIASCIVFITESFLERQQGLLAFMIMYSLLNKPVAEKDTSV